MNFPVPYWITIAGGGGEEEEEDLYFNTIIVKADSLWGRV